MSRVQAYADLVARGCTCGAEDYTPCPLHIGPSDNRGIRAFFEAGMPRGFPMKDCTCMVCKQGGCLIYPNIELDDPKRSGAYRPTLVCSRCSVPSVEAALVR
ncbi:MAG TPA: hypothetical protein VKQ71_12130, partial [Acidimicrobiales bacterium]|nr:hypothetical protein [Acidimicrobiales bacterium]